MIAPGLVESGDATGPKQVSWIVSGTARAAGGVQNRRLAPCRSPDTYFSNDAKHRSGNKWRKLPACDASLSRKLEAYATAKSDTYSLNDAKVPLHDVRGRQKNVPANEHAGPGCHSRRETLE